MRGLLLKDYYTIAKGSRIFVIVVLVFSCLPAVGTWAFALIYSAMLPITAIAYDEQSRWSKLESMMPYRIKDIVLSKYLIGYIFMGVSSVLMLFTSVIWSSLNIGDTLTGPDGVMAAVMIISVGVIMMAVDLPLMIRLGVERGRAVYMVILAASAMIVVYFSGQFNSIFSFLPSRGTGTFIGGMALLALVLSIISIKISCAAYRKGRARS